MINRLKKTSGFGIGFFMVLDLCGQSYEVVRSRMIEAYSEAQSVSVDISIASAKSQESSFSQQAKVRAQGINYWYQWGEVEMLANQKYTIVVNHTLKSITIGVRGPEDTNQFVNNLMSADSVLAPWMDRVVFKGITPDGLNYHFDIEESILKMDLFIDPETYLLRKIVYLENQERGVPQIVINYSNVQLSQKMDPMLFDIGRYVKIEGDRFVGTGKYNHYLLESKAN